MTNSFDRALVNKLVKRVPELLASGLGETNLQVDVKRASFTTQEITVKLKIRLREVNTPEGKISSEQHQFNLACKRYGLEPGDWHRQFKASAVLYRIVGFDAARRKYPVRGQRLSDGKVFCFATHQIVIGLLPRDTSQSDAFAELSRDVQSFKPEQSW